MSEAQNGLLLAVLTGSFTLIGIVIGTALSAVTEYLREKKQHLREMEKRKYEVDEENNRNYLSPLYFHITESIIGVFLVRTVDDLGKALMKLEEKQAKIKTIKELWTNNVHILPEKTNLSLSFYLSDLKAFFEMTNQLSDLVEGLTEQQKKMGITKDFSDYLAKLVNAYDGMTIRMLSSIYVFMKYNISPKEVINFDETTKELKSLCEKMFESLASMLKIS